MKSKFDPNDAFKADVAFDKEDKAIPKGPMVTDTVECDACGFVRCIYSQWSLGSKKYGTSKATQDRCFLKLQQWKEAGYTCGMVPDIKPYLMKRQLQCRSHMESQWYESLKKDDVVICSFCCADENVLSTKDVKKQ